MGLTAAVEMHEVLAYVTLIVAVPLNVFTTAQLYRARRKAPMLRVLRERFVTALVLTLVLLFFAIIFVNNDQTIPPINVDATKIITRTAMLILAVVPAVGWLLLTRRRRR